jgi:hypothetical protein
MHDISVERSVKQMHRQAVFDVVDIGSDKERSDLDRLVGTNELLRIYRDLDSRRFNMYFNRWSAYQLAVAYEKAHNITFHWCVHARLDMFWGSPLLPFSLWNPG